MVGLSRKLTSLVEAVDDPYTLMYAYTRLGVGLIESANSRGFKGRVEGVRSQLLALWFKRQNPLQRLKKQQTEWTREWQEVVKRNQQERDLVARLFRQSAVRLVVRQLSVMKSEDLRKHLVNKDPFVRFFAIRAIGERHIHLEADLTERLADLDPVVREAAHAVLVRVARGTDFGPIPGASQRGIERSIEKWKQWLALQQSASPETVAKNAASAKQAKDRRLEIVPLVLVPEERSAQQVEATKGSEELVNAKGDEQLSVLARLRDAKGIDNTDALALAIPKLSGDIKRQARDALMKRLTRMTAATLRDKLQDDSIEVRLAAALACGHKSAKEHIPDLLSLLDDPERDVVQSARLALTELTGEDFGPAGDADRRGQSDAATAWRKWWKERQGEQK